MLSGSIPAQVAPFSDTGLWDFRGRGAESVVG